MKILFLNPGAELGGAERSLLFLIESLRSARPHWPVELIAGAHGPLLERARCLGATASVCEFPPSLARLGDSGSRAQASPMLAMAGGIGRAALPSLAYLYGLRRAIERAAPDVIHSNGFKMHIMAAYARMPGCRLVWHVRDFVSARPAMSRLMRAHSNRAALAIANSASIADDLRSVCGDGLRIATVHNAVDLERYRPDGIAADLDALAAMPAAAPKVVKIGMVATMARWKGQPVFLRAIKEVAKFVPLRAYVVGGPIYQRDASQFSLSELKRLAADLGISEIVGFTGQVVDTAQVMRALDIVVHASVEPEPFGLVVAEAMACGRATVVAGAGGVMEIVTPGADALVHRPGDAADLANTIVRLALDSDLARRLGAAARLAAERRFSRDRMTAQILPLYERLAVGQAVESGDTAAGSARA
ncbi:MAG TPA: glycosyltransferase [Candidatus Binataceae bacterium]|nr:glycosyltransferase [Candidatus Binataceae bacterium]